MATIRDIFTSRESVIHHHAKMDVMMRADDALRAAKAAAFKPTGHDCEALPATLPRYPIFVSPFKE